MAGLTREGFIPESLGDITDRIESRLEQYNSGFDFSPESPDGQLINIMAAELALAWDELNKVYKSYDPNNVTGQALRNLAQITGVVYPTATRSTAEVDLSGDVGTLVPAGSLVSNTKGQTFYTNSDATIPTTVTVVSSISGLVPVDILTDTISNIESPVIGWVGVTQNIDGTVGTLAQDEGKYRNLRNRTVMRNNKTASEVLGSRLNELGIQQTIVINNDTLATLADGTPPRGIHITVGELGNTTDLEIAEVISTYKGLGVYTHGSTESIVSDSEGNWHSIKFTKSTILPVYINLDVTYLDIETAGASEYIKGALVEHINSLLVGEDVIWSRLFSFITPYGKAQINSLEVSKDNVNFFPTNLSVLDGQYTSCVVDNITVTES